MRFIDTAISDGLKLLTKGNAWPDDGGGGKKGGTLE